MKTPIICLIAIAGLTAYSLIRRPAVPPTPHPPGRLADHDQWVADHGKADLVGFDRFDRLATEVWRLPIPLHQGFVGWKDSEVEWMTYIRPHVAVFFVMVTGPGTDYSDSNHLAWKLFGCSDSRTGQLLPECPGPVIRKD